MPLIVTPGASTADSYAALETAAAYAAAKGLTFPTTGAAQVPAEQALRRSTAGIDANYRARYPGDPANIDQALEFPRTGVMFRGQELPSDTIPVQIVNATIEGAVLELAEPGVLSPNQERRIKTLIAGPVEIDYELGAPVETNFAVIDGILAPLLGAKPGSTTSSFVARA